MLKLRNLFFIISLLIIAFGTGYKFGQKQKAIIPVKSETVRQTDKSIQKGLDFSLFWDVWDRLYMSYLEKEALDPQKMIFGAISGMVASLDDPYTVFLTPSQNKEAKDDLGGKFEGIGAQLGVKDKKIVVVAPLPKSPAEEAGLAPGDWIIKVDGKDTLNWTLPETVTKIRGPRGSKVVLAILHKDAEKSQNIEIERREINVPSVEWKEIFVNCQTGNDRDKKCSREENLCPSCQTVFYLKLNRFGDSTNNEWTKAVTEIAGKISSSTKKKNLGLILDLRNNPGGYLSGSVFIASEFLDDGVVVIQQEATRSKKTYRVDREGKLTDVPLTVLINKGSASASEIVAGALRIRKNIKLVGETSFGKGTIQEAQELANGAGIHITTAKWLMPDSSSLNGEGLKPSIEVLNDETNPDTDLQLEAAIDVLFEK